MIETWNDYEEGTAIERLNFAKCGQNTKPDAAQSTR